MKKLLRSLLSVATFFYIVAGLPAIALAFLLVWQGETTQGRMFGAACVLGFPAPVLFWLGTFLNARRRWFLTGGCFLAPAVLLLAVCYGMTPNGRTLPGSNADSVFTGKTSYQRTSPANLVPAPISHPDWSEELSIDERIEVSEI